MSIIKAKYCEIEIQAQHRPDSPAYWQTIISYQPDKTESKEIISVIFTDFDPFIKWTKDLGDKIISMPTPKDIAANGPKVFNTDGVVKDE